MASITLETMIAAITLSLVLGSVTSLKCHRGNKIGTVGVFDPIDCDPKKFPTPVCSKNTTTITGNVVSVIKDCINYSGPLNCTITSSFTAGTTNIELCYCNNPDLCNSAGRSRISYVTLIFGVLAFILYCQSTGYNHSS